MKTGIHIGSIFNSPTSKQLITALTQLAEQAITMGRTEAAVEAIARLGKMGAVENTNITSNYIGDSK